MSGANQLNAIINQYDLYRVFRKVTDKLNDHEEGTEWDNFRIGIHVFRNEPDSIQDFDCKDLVYIIPMK